MILDEILQHKRQEVEARKSAKPLLCVATRAANGPPVRNFAQALTRKEVNIIAEIKRHSPSAGALDSRADPAERARQYTAGGAAAVSVLTDQEFFHGSLADLEAVRQATTLPVLRKDFIIDSYQLYESRAAGADAVLLIAAALGQEELETFLKRTHELGMQALVEVHDEKELDRAQLAGARVIGINNRDLRTFQVTLETSARLAQRVSPEAEKVLVSESGIKTPDDVRRLHKVGFRAFLVGETLMRSNDPAGTIRELVSCV